MWWGWWGGRKQKREGRIREREIAGRRERQIGRERNWALSACSGGHAPMHRGTCTHAQGDVHPCTGGRAEDEKGMER